MLKNTINEKLTPIILKKNNINKKRSLIDELLLNENKNLVEFLFHNKLNSNHYYSLCEILNNTLSSNDIWNLNRLTRNNLNESVNRLKISHIKSMVFCELSIFELELQHQILSLINENTEHSLSYALELLNTYKNEVFNLRKKIRPHYLSYVSDDFINKINNNHTLRDEFRVKIENLILEKIKPFLKNSKKNNVTNTSKTILIILEEIQEKHNSTVNKLIFDWIHCISTYLPEYKIEILVTNDINKDIIPGVTLKPHVNIEDLLRELDLDCNKKKIKVKYRDVKSECLFTWLKENVIYAEDLLGVVLFPSPRWPLARLIKDMAPTIAVELANGVNLNDMADIILPNGITDSNVRSKYGEKLFEVPFPQIPFPTTKAYKRKEFNLNKNDFVIISVGRQLFSRSNISIIEYFSYVTDLLDKKNNLKWIFVGEDINNTISETVNINKYLDSNQIITITEEKDLMALYSICDLFAMPPIRGGGRGIGLAASSGLACISFDISDGSKSFPKDLVFKKEEIDLYFKEILNLSNNPVDYKITSDKCKNIFTHELFESSAIGLVKALEKANGSKNE